MFHFIPILLLQCVYLLPGEHADAAGISVMRRVIMCKRWCERRNRCSEAACNVSIECTGSETPLSAGRSANPIPQHFCDTCPQHQVCLHISTGVNKCVDNDSQMEKIEGRTRSGSRKTGSDVICKKDAKSCVQTLRHGHSNKKKDYKGEKIHVMLIKNHVSMNVVHYSIFAKNNKRRKSFPAFDEPKIYYWLMSIGGEKIRSRENTRGSFSFKIAVTKQFRVGPNPLKQATVCKGITVSVGKHITFKSHKDTAVKLRRRGGRFVVVLDKLKGRMFLGTRRKCLAAKDSIDARSRLYPVMVHPSISRPAEARTRYRFNVNKRRKFIDEDVENLMRRCEHKFVL